MIVETKRNTANATAQQAKDVLLVNKPEDFDPLSQFARQRDLLQDEDDALSEVTACLVA